MDLLSEFLVTILVAIVMQNAVFTRAFGFTKGTISINKPRKIIFFGSTITGVMLATAIIAWPLNYWLREYNRQNALRYLLYIGCLCIIFVAVHLVTKYFVPKLHFYYRTMLPFAVFNSAVLGSLLIAAGEGYGYLKTLGFAIGSGVGYTLALLLIHEGKKRIHLSQVPRSFRGLPIMILYIGIFSLAIYGLIGHQLPT
ncbi:Rnf-Nqr domain containing protein [Youxingia wuxianensis]|uniref:Electron transport complex protein RnfA n=1 Tax=Youxingia wuxianensis TaxID=2763678 RepID=A0A926IBU8_9FIRM|nr:Rnf-Nqr domain containing protein [Youxingia wuxianensis]MBC8584502.1 hypothetical protein [Youxingia wuxianensis]